MQNLWPGDRKPVGLATMKILIFAAAWPLARADHAFTGAVATLRGATSAITGEVVIEELSPLLVSVEATVSGVADGVYGFHIHQYGDLRSPLDLETVGRHFIPLCGSGKSSGGGHNHVEFTAGSGGDDRRRMQDWMPPGTRLVGNLSDDQVEGLVPCANDQVHGYPPSEWRMPGDMGNITIEGGVGTFSAILGQDKISLTDVRFIHTPWAGIWAGVPPGRRGWGAHPAGPSKRSGAPRTMRPRFPTGPQSKFFSE